MAPNPQYVKVPFPTLAELISIAREQDLDPVDDIQIEGHAVAFLVDFYRRHQQDGENIIVTVGH
jgi:hypothetical protein